MGLDRPSMTRVIHTGDTHIGYRQYHSPERRRDFLEAFEQVIADAIESDVDAVVHAGDLFHDTRPDLPDLMETIRVLRRLAAAEIPFLAIVGNHEGTRDRQWLDLFADLDLARRLDAAGTTIGDVTFYGLDYVPPAQRHRLTYEFDSPETETTALVAHGLFEPFAHSNWETAELLSAASVDFDALLLADNHTPDRAQVAGTWLTYCGSTERTSAAEREERGYNLVTFDEEIRIARRTIAGTRPFVFVAVELSGNEGSERVIDDVTAHDVTDAVVIVHLRGEGADVPPALVEEAVAAEGALLVRVIDEREQPDEASPAVRFADPDRAVEDRVRELGLSPAGRMVDEIVRDGTVAASNVRTRVRSRIETLLAEAPAAFEPGELSGDEADHDAAPTPDATGTERTDSQTSIGEYR